MRGLALILAASVALAAAPAPAQQAPAVPEKMPFDIPYGMPNSMEMAKKAVEAAEAEARKRNWKLAIAVVSPAGDLTYS
jgi:hypothetical protein